VLLVALAGWLGSYTLLLVFALPLGIAGTTFAVGIPFLNGWYEVSRRGFATGLFGAGMQGRLQLDLTGAGTRTAGFATLR
jgi:NNP family nitrate/nitrite transporter-like MFS transporter